MKEHILQYLIDTYDPEAIITYGSYSDGSANAHSDFDALIIAEHSSTHDGSVVCGVTLDVFIYPESTFAENYNPQDFIQVYDGVIEFDKRGTAQKLKEAVRQQLGSRTHKTAAVISQEIEWCKKMLLRTGREDAEGYFRWHWLLTDSLEIYFDIIKEPYFGPKKSLRHLAEIDREGFKKYENALKHFDHDTLADWICYMADAASAFEK